MDAYDDYSYLEVKGESKDGILKYGFVNSDGDWVISPIYNELTEFDDWGNCLAKYNDKWGRLNVNGQWEIKPVYEELKSHFDIILGGQLMAKLNHKWGVLDSFGNWLVKPKYDEIEEGSYGTANKSCFFVQTNNKWGVINENGEWLLNPIFDDTQGNFDIEGCCGVKLNDRWGFIHFNGEWAIPPKFYAISNRHNLWSWITSTPGYNPKDGLCVAQLNEDDKWGFINRKGDWVIPPDFDLLSSKFDNDGYCYAVEGSREGMIDRNGNWVELRKDNQKTNPGVKITDSIEETSSALDQLDTLVGLYGVKEEIKSLYSFIKTQSARKAKGLKQTSISYHCVFTGSPGTGKNTVARIIASIYKELGILKKGHLVETDRSGLVGGYVGQTAIKVNEVVDAALDGVLFIDEAYSLANESSSDFGQEAINTLMKRIEDDRDRLIVVLAGYKEEMDVLIEKNPGFKSRFNNYINFQDYTPENLIAIFKNLCASQEYILSKGAEDCLVEIITTAHTNRDKTFGNARFVRNLFEKTIKNLSRRITDFDNSSKEMLSTIEVDDFR
jgi:hypothetical protein